MYKHCALTLLILNSLFASAQVASHAPTNLKPNASAAPMAEMTLSAAGKPVVSVNGTLLTDRDLVREMFAMFPYAQQHNGKIPKNLEPEIRQGALQMIVFEELLYQEAKGRKMVIPAERLRKAEREFRKTFADESAYKAFLKEEAHGSVAELREKIRRSFLIDAIMKAEITNKAKVTPVQVKAYYDKNPLLFQRAETIHFQSISILPPNESPATLKEARKRADEAVKQAKLAKTYRDFGLLAEKISEDDYRVNMGDHKKVPASQLPPPVVKVVAAMKPGDVSDLIQLGNAFTIVRLEEHIPSGTVPFAEVKDKLKASMENEKLEQLRSALGKKLRSKAKIQIL
ncbi:MAG: peptidyl-prolyl cis-trans isomerase [Terriglobia bacterium]|nr:peptidyl-prolyl cis-trans isomerase [Terriglobia bacterium]